MFEGCATYKVIRAKNSFWLKIASKKTVDSVVIIRYSDLKIQYKNKVQNIMQRKYMKQVKLQK